MTAMTDTLQAIRKVRQTRRYAPDPVDPEALREILEVARWSGSAANRQPWHFVVVDDREQLRQLSEVRPELPSELDDVIMLRDGEIVNRAS